MRRLSATPCLLLFSLAGASQVCFSSLGSGCQAAASALNRMASCWATGSVPSATVCLNPLGASRDVGSVLQQAKPRGFGDTPSSPLPALPEPVPQLWPSCPPSPGADVGMAHEGSRSKVQMEQWVLRPLNPAFSSTFLCLLSWVCHLGLGSKNERC